MSAKHQEIYSHPGPKVLKRFKEVTLVAFLGDLKNLEGKGLTKSQCEAVQEGLKAVEKVAQSLPDHRPFIAYRARLEKFRERYIRWNSAGDPDARKHHHVRLTDSRRKLNLDATTNNPDRERELDAIMGTDDETAKKLHAALKKITGNSEVGELFGKLSESLAEF